MGQSTSSFVETKDGTVLKTNENSRSSLLPLSTQDTERNRSREHKTIQNTCRASPTTTVQKALVLHFSHYSTSDFKQDDLIVKEIPFHTNHVQTLQVSKKYSKESNDRSKPMSLKKKWWKKQFPPPPQNNIATFTNRVMVASNDLEKTMFYFAKNKRSEKSFTSSQNVAEMHYQGSIQETKESCIDYVNSNKEATKLVFRDSSEVRNELIQKISHRGKKEMFYDPLLICGTQVFATRCQQEEKQNDIQCIALTESKNTFFEKKSQFICIQDVNPNKTNQIKAKDLEVVLKDRQNIEFEIQHQSSFMIKSNFKPLFMWTSLYNPSERGELLSARVSRGIAKKTFDGNAILGTMVDPASTIVCVSKTNNIYVCDLGLSSSRCDFIVDIAERCSKGSYNAYTYAKQTLGCRDYDELAVVCEWPVMRAVATIREHLQTDTSKVEEKAPAIDNLILDDREPHIVKYDVSRKERQKLDMHTDKSEWTFLIALTDGFGDDYDGGGTYFECIDSTVHLEKGQALIFPGQLRHRGQKIINGKRFLLVGFMVKKP